MAHQNLNLVNDKPWESEPFGCGIAGHNHRSVEESASCSANRWQSRSDPASYLSRPFVSRAAVSASCAFERDVTRYVECPVMTDDLASIINLAVSVGRGTATIKELSNRLAPYGVRRRQ